MVGTVYLELKGDGEWETLRGIKLKDFPDSEAVVVCFDILEDIEDYQSYARVVKVTVSESPPDSGQRVFVAD